MQELFKILFGEFTLIQLIGYLWFFLIGTGIFSLVEVTGRDVKSKNTPEKWSWKFWFKDNYRRYLTTILCTYVLFRFYSEICGHPFSNLDAVQMGLLGDGLASTIKKRIGGLGFDKDRRRYMDNNYEENNNEHDDDGKENHDERFENKDNSPKENIEINNNCGGI